MILWPDTFNEPLPPGVGVAAVEALEAAGCQVDDPRAAPLLRAAALRLRDARPRAALPASACSTRCATRSGQATPIVGHRAELRRRLQATSCRSCCRRRGRRAARRKQTFHLAEFLRDDRATSRRSSRRKALVHGHCHHKATGGIEPERELLEKMGLEVETLDSGCCGHGRRRAASSAAHYDISMRMRRARCCCRRCARRRRRRCRRRRLLLRDADRAGQHGPAGAARRAGAEARARAGRDPRLSGAGALRAAEAGAKSAPRAATRSARSGGRCCSRGEGPSMSVAAGSRA